MHKFSSRLALGTANFGLNYGINNDSGKVEQTAIEKIKDVATFAGIEFIDTAQAYGDSELRIGSFKNEKFNIISKFSSQNYENISASNVRASVIESMRNLNRKRIYGVLIHHSEVLLGLNSKEIIRGLTELKETGLVEKIGLSIYEPDILNEAFNQFDFDIIQLPFNVFDQRIIESGWVEKLQDKGVEIHSRSVFLQGLLLKNSSQLLNYFYHNWKSLFDKWYDIQQRMSKDSVTLALGHVLSQSWIDKIIVGIDNANQLEQLIQIERFTDHINLNDLKCNDINLINPSNWKLC